VNVRIILENGGRPSGEADVEFATHEEAVKAMCKVYIGFFFFFLKILFETRLDKTIFKECCRKTIGIQFAYIK